MTLLLAIFASGILIGAYALLAPRREDVSIPPAYSLLVHPIDDVAEAYKKLSEAARCDLVLAITEFNDAHSQRILALALDDPSKAVALAAAHVFARAGHSHRVTDQLLETVTLLS